MRADRTMPEIVKMRCPYCGASFSAKTSQKEGLCYNCGRRMHLAVMRHDAGAKIQGYDSYENLLRLAQSALDAADYTSARALFGKAADAAPDDYRALFGYLMAHTNYLTEITGRLPVHEYRAALAAASSDEAQALRAAWAKYEAQYNKYWDAQRKAAEEKRERKRRREEEERAAREKRQEEREAARQQTVHNAGSTEAGPKQERRLPPVVRYLLIGAGGVLAMLGLAACAAMGTGGGAFFFLIALGFFGSGRNRRR